MKQATGKELRDLISQQVRGEDAMAPFFTNIDCKTFEHFERWLAGQFKQMVQLQANLNQRIENGEADDEDKELLEFVMGKSDAFHNALLTFRRVQSLERSCV